MAIRGDLFDVTFHCISCKKEFSRKVSNIEFITRRYDLPQGWSSLFSCGDYIEFCDNENCQEAYKTLTDKKEPNAIRR